MTIAKKEIKVLDDHIEELEKLQKDYSEKIELLTRQREDFDILIMALCKQLESLKDVDMDQTKLELSSSS
jgi:prefoldin subunit 5|tara:strand:+ start:1041 stop:1250 length:210 start_codon:yes stop_codon:yes gene_type:complete